MKKIILGMATATAIVFTSSSIAIPTISVGFDVNSDGTFDEIVTDGDPFGGIFPDLTGDLNPNVNEVTAWLNDSTRVTAGTLSIDPFNLHMTAELTNPGTMTFGVTAVGLTLSDVGSLVFTMGGSGFSTSTTSAYLDTGNGQFGINDILIGSITGPSPLSFSSNQLEITDTDLFSLTLVTSITSISGGASVDADINVPEPSIIALFGLGLAGIGFVGRKRRVK